MSTPSLEPFAAFCRPFCSHNKPAVGKLLETLRFHFQHCSSCFSTTLTKSLHSRRLAKLWNQGRRLDGLLLSAAPPQFSHCIPPLHKPASRPLSFLPRFGQSGNPQLSFVALLARRWETALIPEVALANNERPFIAATPDLSSPVRSLPNPANDTWYASSPISIIFISRAAAAVFAAL